MSAAEPTGDVRELSRLCEALQQWHDAHPPIADDRERTRLTVLIGQLLDLLALPAVRDALAAQETVRRVEALTGDLESYVVARGYPQTGSYDDGLSRAQAAAAADLRRTLAGES